jgi:hypothetical protein
LCEIQRSAAIVIISYQPSSRPPLPVFVRGLQNIAHFWPQPSTSVDVFAADNNAEDPGSADLLRNASFNVFGNAQTLKIVPNKGLANGYRFVYGALRSVIFSEGWLQCFPYHYLVVMHSAMALLVKLPFDPPNNATGVFGFNFRPFMTFSLRNYDWGSDLVPHDWGEDLGTYVWRSVEDAGISFVDGREKSLLDVDGVFGLSFVMSRTCLASLLQRRLIVDFPKVKTKEQDIRNEVLTGVLAHTLCGWRGDSFDGTIDRYMEECTGGGEGCAHMSEEKLRGRTIMKVWGTAGV